ncbi:MAG TPA: hypothetical protein VGA66_00015 [Mycobacterium sp.]
MTKSIGALLVVMTAVFVGAPSAAAQDGGLEMSATIDGHDVGAASSGDPLRLEPGQSVEVVLELTNRGSDVVDLRRVELAGHVLGLTFFNYSTEVGLTVAPGAADTLRYRLDLYGLDGQATGLIAGALTVVDAEADAVASIPTVTDVRGSLISVYGLFGIALVVLTALALVDAALALARHRLSANRWQRGLRLLAPGVGIGLVVAFSASVARLWVPNTGLWLVLSGLTATLFFALGYFSPTPDDDDDEFDDEFDDDAMSNAETGQLPTGEFGR